jgi:hypothetical protein
MLSSDSDFDTVALEPQCPKTPNAEEALEILRGPKRKRARGALQTCGSIIAAAWLVCDGAKPCEVDTVTELWAKGNGNQPKFDQTVFAVVGLCFFTWHFVKRGDAEADLVSAAWQNHLLNKHSRKNIGSFIAYNVEGFHLLEEPLALSHDNIRNHKGLCDLWTTTLCDGERSDSDEISRLLKFKNITTRITSFVTSSYLAECIGKGTVDILHIDFLSPRCKLKEKFWRKHPTPTMVKKLQKGNDKEQPISDGIAVGAVAPETKLLELPPNTPEFQSRKTLGGKMVPAFDACKSLRLMRFSRHVKDKGNYGAALNDAIEAICDDEETKNVLIAGQTENPKRTNHVSGIHRMDAVGCLLDRRELAHRYETARDDLVSAHLFTDGSPVTGVELQGMVLQFLWNDDSVDERIMPGVALHYGGCSLWDKVFAFLWSLWLIASSLPVMRWVIDSICSVTTDMGTELNFIDCEDVLAAFFVWLTAKLPFADLSKLIVPGSRMFPQALKIPDWSHIMGNMMKHAAYKVSKWKEISESLRALCKFFRCTDWRNRIISKVEADYPESRGLLKTFTARQAKWRYQTLFDVLGQLLPLRYLAETFLVDIDLMFTQFEDKDLLSEVKAACRWSDLWIFISSFFFAHNKPP